MGGAQSRPTSPLETPSPTAASPTAASPPDRPPLSSSRFSSFQRLSSLTKRRDRHLRGSTAGTSDPGGERKKRKVDDSSPSLERDSVDVPLHQDEGVSAADLEAAPTNTVVLAEPEDGAVVERTGAPTPNAPLAEPTSRIPTPLPPPLATPLGDVPVIPDPMAAPPPLFASGSSASESGASSPDVLRRERLASLSSIRDALGPDWPVAPAGTTETPASPTRRARPHSVPDASPLTAAASGSDGGTGLGLTDRLTALLGIASPASNITTPPSITDGELDQLSHRLQRARADLDDAERRITEIRQTRDETRRQLENRMPTGPMVVIQGLAQTHAIQDSAEVPAGSSASSVASGEEADRSRPLLRRMRRSSDGQVARRGGNGDEQEGTSIESQARMISGLLTVAAAATASTLLAPPDQTPNAPARTGAAAALENLMNRLRPARSRPTGGAEEVLGNYLRNALRDNHRLDSSTTAILPFSSTPGGSSEAISTEFQAFINNLRDDLVTAVRNYVQPDESDDNSGVISLVPSPAVTTTTTASSTASAPTAPGPPQGQTTPVPAFHVQLGQTGSSSTRGGRLDVTGGSDGRPRRLNFMRAHLFPAIHPERGNTTSIPSDDPSAVVPCLFIGVRSIAHDPNMSTEDLVSHPNFPFTSGEVPAATPPFAGASSPSTPSLSSPSVAVNDDSPADLPSPPLAPAATTTPERRSLRERVLASLSRRTEQAPRGPSNTYLVYVIGGYYPRSHPVLSIPNLATGGPLSDEEMALVSEMMGQVKPPTASKEDIEKSGLKVVDASRVREMEENGELLSSCVERCLICLDDYEPGQECRILACRHGYHKDCVDHWLSNGRNSCPACRTEAVNTASAPTATSSTNA